MKMSRKTGVVALAVSMLMAGAAFAQEKVQGTIHRTNGTSQQGFLKWKAREKVYAVTTKDIDIEIPVADVLKIDILKPKDLTDAEKHIRDNNPTAAVPLLEKVAKDYLMLVWDKPATRLLADAYLKAGEVDKALAACETLIRSDPPGAYLGPVAPIYWQALLKKKQNGKVEELIAKAIKSGDRAASAAALVMRGDAILITGDTSDNAKKALKDAYLRVVMLYNTERDVLPEALYKAAKCFEKTGQTARADSFRSELKREFAGTVWAAKP